MYLPKKFCEFRPCHRFKLMMLDEQYNTNKSILSNTKDTDVDYHREMIIFESLLTTFEVLNVVFEAGCTNP